jgi:hypothetical protein
MDESTLVVGTRYKVETTDDQAPRFEGVYQGVFEGATIPLHHFITDERVPGTRNTVEPMVLLGSITSAEVVT